MLTMNVELWPLGAQSSAKRLVTINLANVGYSNGGYDRRVCDYVWTIDEFKPLFGIPPIQSQGVLRGYNRESTCVDMLAAILDDYRLNGDSSVMTEYEKNTVNNLRHKTIKNP